jgi:S-DNA-T family DNA segregation ATPase FtsK/SpoIIIE
MAKAKGNAGRSAPKGQAKQKLENKKTHYGIAGLVLMGLGMFTLLSILTGATGILGKAVADVLYGVFGLLCYLVALFFVMIGWLVMIAWNKRINAGKVFFTSLTLVSVMVLITLIFGNVADVNERSFTQVLSDSYQSSLELHSGAGALGAVLTYPLLLLTGKVGSYIICFVALIAGIVGVTGMSLANAGQRVNQTVVTAATQVADIARDRAKAHIAKKKEKQFLNERLKPFEFKENEADAQAGQEGLSIEEELTLRKRAFPSWETNIKIGEELRARAKAHQGEGEGSEIAQQPEPAETAVKNEAAEQDDVFGLPPIAEIDMPELEALPVFAIRPSDLDERSPRSILEMAEEPKRAYRFPSIKLLHATTEKDAVSNRRSAQEQAEQVKTLEETLDSFGINAKVTAVSRGPAITRYEVVPARGVKVSRITGLADDIALNMAAMGVRIEAPIPGKAAVGIEVPNKEVAIVHLKEVLRSEAFQKHKSALAVALGRDIAGKPIVADLARMPHVLIAGATGSGKSVCINCIVASILYKATPDEVQMIVIDPKVVELNVYNGIPHLLIPVVTDPKKASGALGWVVQEMTDRYKKFAATGHRDILGYNDAARLEGSKTMPYIVVIIDELADLMLVAPGEVEDRVQRLAQLARASGIHLVIATQRPSVNVITGVIKSNIPSRIAFAVASQVDSRVILDMSGAEKLLGRGDMLYDPSGASKPVRVQGAYISDQEVAALVEAVKQNDAPTYDPDFMEVMAREDGEDGGADAEEEHDELLEQAVQVAIEAGQISASMLQRKFRVGYARAGRLLDEMEKRALISGFEGSKPRQVLVSRAEYERIFNRPNDLKKENISE